MKTVNKFITALAVIAVLAALSCVPEAEITEPNYKEIFAEYNEQVGGAVVDRPTISGTLVIGAATPDQKELEISFPQDADVLRESNADIDAALKKFLSFHTYTDSLATAFNTLSVVSPEAIPYKFVKRGAGLNQQVITISFDTIPIAQIFVAKFNENYTCGNGHKVNLDFPNTKSKDAVYGDFYVEVFTTGGSPAPTVPYYGFEHPGPRNWSIYVSGLTGGTFSTPSPQDVLAGGASISFYGGTPAEKEAERKEILSAWVSKFELQKWDGTAWTKDAGGVFSYRDATTIPTGSGTFHLVYTPADKTAYRIAMNGTENLTTEKEYYGMKQKVAVSGSGLMGTASYYRDVVYGGAGFWYNDTSLDVQSSTPVISGYVNADYNGKNVVVALRFAPITVGGVDQYPKELPLETFNKNFKIVFSRSDQYVVGNLTSINDLVFVKVNKVTYGTSAYNPGNKDEIVLELDPSYQYRGGGTKYLLIAPGFKYSSDQIVFGNYDDNWNWELDGVKYWEAYTLPVNF
ncbi:MAG: hypothetical protein LBV17_12320 [Treponema sp.]|jgi:hypothetical protein|nr:hypothetical protein [Treponema sp.]